MQMEDSSNEYELDNDDIDEADEYDDELHKPFLKRKNSFDSPLILSNKYSNKKRKCRTTFSKSQLCTLEKEFLNSNFVSNERIDLIIELTGLDSRIIKNWFKNKRSRVLADSKTTTNPPPSTQILTSSPPLNVRICETQKQELFVQTANLSPYSKENIETTATNFYSNNQSDTIKKLSTPGLLNIIANSTDSKSPITKNHLIKENNNSIKPNEKKRNEQDSIKFKNHTITDSVCQTCSSASNLFCKCNVSKQALTKLYSGLNGYSSTFLDRSVLDLGCGYYDQQMGSKNFEIL